MLIVCLGGILRFYGLDRESIWRDEGSSIWVAGMNLGELLENRARDYHAPLYFVFLHEWVHLFGSSEFSVRTLSVLFGLACIPAIYTVGKTLFADRRVGLLSAFLLAIAQMQIRYSQEARMYAMVSFLALVSMYFFLRVIRGEGRSAWLGYLLSSVCMVYAHNSGWFIIAVQNAAVLSRRLLIPGPMKPPRGAWLWSQLGIAAAEAPWLIMVCTRKANFRLVSGEELSAGNLYDCARAYAGSDGLLALYLAASVFALAAAAVGAGLGRAGRRRLQLTRAALHPAMGNVGRAGGTWFLLAWLLIPLGLLASAVLAFRVIPLPRYAIVGSLALYLLAARGIAALPARSHRMLAVGVFLAFSIWPLAAYFSKNEKEQWREAVAYVEAGASPNDLVLFTSQKHLYACFNYYAQRDDLVKKPTPTTKSLRTGGEEILNGPLLQGRERFWLVRLSPHPLFVPQVNTAVKSAYQVAQHVEFRGLHVYLFKRRKAVVTEPALRFSPGARDST